MLFILQMQITNAYFFSTMNTIIYTIIFFEEQVTFFL